jgi:hypothetical protein
MNKLFILLIALFCSFSALAQTSPKQAEQYCQVLASAKPFSTKVSITVDYGQETKLFGDRGVVRSEDGKIQNFNSVIDALNYMSSQGWQFVNAYAITVGGQNVYHYVMRRVV